MPSGSAGKGGVLPWSGMRREQRRQTIRQHRVISAALLALAALCAVAMLGFTAALAAPQESEEGLLVALDGEGRLLPLGVAEGPFDAVLTYGESGDESIKQAWQYNIYAQFYFPGEDPQIDYTFLGNRKYPRLLLKLDRKAALIWVSSASTRAEAEEYCRGLRRQGLEGAFVARARGSYGYKHSAGQQAMLSELASTMDTAQCKGKDPLGWLTERDLARRYAVAMRLVYIDNVSGVNDALELRDEIKAAIGECGMLNRPAGGYRLFCGAYGDRQSAVEAVDKITEVSGYVPEVICINGDGLQTRWMEEDLSR